MSTKLQVRITKEILQLSAYCGHIKEQGKYMLSDDESVAVGCNCAIALAIRDIFPKAMVGPTTILPFGEEPFSTCFSEIDLPEEAIAFVREFDDCMPEKRRKMKACKFEVEIPDDVLDHAFQIKDDLELLLKGRSNTCKILK